MKNLKSLFWRIYHALGGTYDVVTLCQHDWAMATVILPTRGLLLQTGYCVKCGQIGGGGIDDFKPEGHTELLELQNKIKHATPRDVR